MRITKEQIKTINTYDKVATDTFGVDKQFGFRFNWNFRWFWGKSSTYYNYKTHLQNLPLSESKKITTIHLN